MAQFVVSAFFLIMSRFMSVDTPDVRRRYARNYMRGCDRDDQRERAGSRHKRYPCCQNRRQRCRCGEAIAPFINESEFKQFEASLSAAQLLSMRDTADCGHAVDAVLRVAGPLATDVGAVFALSSMRGPWLPEIGL